MSWFQLLTAAELYAWMDSEKSQIWRLTVALHAGMLKSLREGAGLTKETMLTLAGLPTRYNTVDRMESGAEVFAARAQVLALLQVYAKLSPLSPLDTQSIP